MLETRTNLFHADRDLSAKPSTSTSNRKNNLMKESVKWFAAALVAASGLIAATSVQAQGITGTTYLSNINPTNVQFFQVWATPAATITSTALGLEINAPGGSGTFSSSYYALPAGQIQPNNPSATQVTFSYIWNSGNAVAGVNVLFSLDDSGGGAADYYGTGYVIPHAGVNTFTFALQSGNLADYAAGKVIAGTNFQIDPANVSGNYDITYSSITLSPVPEPTTAALAGLGVASLWIFRRRNK